MKVTHILPLEEVGEKKFKKQTVVFQKGENSLAVTFLGDKGTAMIEGLEVGNEAQVEYTVKSREWKGKWYSEVIGDNISFAKSETPKQEYKPAIEVDEHSELPF